MINNFEDITQELSGDEKKVLPILINGLKNCIGKEKSYSNKKIKGILLTKYNIKLSEPRLRKIIQYIRVKGLVPCLIATSKGYYVSNDMNEVRDYCESLQQRINAIKQTKESIENQIIKKWYNEHQYTFSVESPNQTQLGL